METFEVEADDNSYKKGGFWRIFQKKLTKEQHIIRSLKPEFKNCKFTEVNSELVQQKLLELEYLDVFDKKYRIGLVYSKPNQNHETEMFCNSIFISFLFSSPFFFRSLLLSISFFFFPFIPSPDRAFPAKNLKIMMNSGG